VIVDNALYRKGVRVPQDCDIADLAEMRSRISPGDFVWIGLHDPTAEELREVAEAFELHPLAVEDAVHAHQRPKLERYDDSLFLVLKSLWYVDEDDAVETGEINIFAAHDFVVTVRHGDGGSLAGARRRLEEQTEVLMHGPSSVLYAVCDQAVDDYESVAAELVQDVDEVEASVFSDERTSDSARIYVLKRELAEMRRAVIPLKDPLSRFSTSAVRGVDPESAPYFRDVADHLARVSETVDSLDMLLSSAFEAHLAQISLQQNDDMRRISAGAGLVLVPTLIAGVYGMNFTHMPELSWRYGYPYALGLMVVSAVALYRLFKKSGWL
jgi:magnesium transporter